MIQELEVIEAHCTGVPHNDHILELIPNRGFIHLASLDLLLLVLPLPLLEDRLHLGHILLLQLLQVAHPFCCLLRRSSGRIPLENAKPRGQGPGDETENEEHQPHQRIFLHF